jgi:cation diffusion facilitator CzcD-associated flavoprotein CzcO
LDEPYSDEERHRFATDPDAMREHRQKIYQDINAILPLNDMAVMASLHKLALTNLRQVVDPVVRAQLTPGADTPFACKRPPVTSAYYPAFNLPHVRLVTTPIERFTAAGIRTVDGSERDAQTVIYATGFAASRFLSAIDVTGRDGVSIQDAWAGGAQAYLGVTTSGFPNLFMLYGPNTNNGSIIFMIECQVDYIVRKLQAMRVQNVAWIDVRRDAMDDYNAALQRDIAAVGPWQGSCSNYYRAPSGRIVTQWPHDMTSYRDRLAREDAQMYELSTS